uniref:Uncharacterized protein n=1 Tax=Romanomermis culicivorax TaxID=13658 RepID=A0A915HZI1_ROMCU
MASVHVLMANELLDQRMSTTTPEPSDDKLLETPIFNLNVAKLPIMVMTLLLTVRQPDLMVLVTARSHGSGDFDKQLLETYP